MPRGQRLQRNAIEPGWHADSNDACTNRDDLGLSASELAHCSGTTRRLRDAMVNNREKREGRQQKQSFHTGTGEEMNAAILAKVIFLSRGFADPQNPGRNAFPALWNAMERLQIAAK
jgi:hypothetical protein